MAGATVVPTRCDLDGDRRPRRRLSVIQRPGRGVGDVGIGPQTAADGPQDGAELHVVAAALRHRGDPVAGAGQLPAGSGASTGAGPTSWISVKLTLLEHRKSRTITIRLPELL